MTTQIVLVDFVQPGGTIVAGTLLNSADITAEQEAAGLVHVLYNAGTMADALAAYKVQRALQEGVAPNAYALLNGLIAAGAFSTSTPGNLTVTGTLDVADATTLDDTLDVTGAATFAATAEVDGNLTVNTNKFTVDAATGDTAIARDLAVTRNETVGGTLAVTGASTLTGAVAATAGVTNGGIEVWTPESLTAGNPTGNHVVTKYSGLSGNVTVTMPAATTAGKVSVIINLDASHTVTVAGKTLAQNQTAMLIADGSAWQLVASTGT